MFEEDLDASVVFDALAMQTTAAVAADVETRVDIWVISAVVDRFQALILEKASIPSAAADAAAIEKSVEVGAEIEVVVESKVEMGVVVVVEPSIATDDPTTWEKYQIQHSSSPWRVA